MLSYSFFYRNNTKHTANDSLDYNKMSQLVNALSYYMQELA